MKKNYKCLIFMYLFYCNKKLPVESTELYTENLDTNNFVIIFIF